MGCCRRTNWWVAEILVESITLFVCLLFFFHSTCHFGGYCFNICYVFRPSQPMSQILRDLRLLCACVCVYEYQYTITCAYISLVLSLFRFHVDLLEQWTVVHYLIWLVCLAVRFVFVVFFSSYSIHYYGIGYRTFCLHHIAFPIAFICGTLLCNVKQYW